MKKYSQTVTNEFSKFLITSKRKPLKIESDRGGEIYNSIFQNFLFLGSKNVQHYSRFTDKGPSIAERVNRFIGNLLKKPIFLAGNADWFSKLLSVIKQNNNTFHSSTKTTPIQASKKLNEKLVYSNLQDRRVKQKPEFHLSQLVRTADIKRVFSKGDSTNWSYKFYIQSQKSYMTLFLAIESTINPRDKMKTYYYQPNYLLNKAIKL